MQNFPEKKGRSFIMDIYGFADFVAIDNSDIAPSIGRVSRDDGGSYVLVCLEESCAETAVPREALRLATEEEIASCTTRIGGHRFMSDCPSYDRDACFECGHDEREKF